MPTKSERLAISKRKRSIQAFRRSTTLKTFLEPTKTQPKEIQPFLTTPQNKGYTSYLNKISGAERYLRYIRSQRRFINNNRQNIENKQAKAFTRTLLNKTRKAERIITSNSFLKQKYQKEINKQERLRKLLKIKTKIITKKKPIIKRNTGTKINTSGLTAPAASSPSSNRKASQKAKQRQIKEIFKDPSIKQVKVLGDKLQIHYKPTKTQPKPKPAFLPTQKFSKFITKAIEGKKIKKLESIGFGGRFVSNIFKGGAETVKAGSNIITFATFVSTDPKYRKQTEQKIKEGAKTIKGIRTEHIKATAKATNKSVKTFLAQKPTKIADDLLQFSGRTIGGAFVLGGVGKLATVKIATKPAKVLARTRGTKTVKITSGNYETTGGKFLQNIAVQKPKRFRKGYKKPIQVVRAGTFKIQRRLDKRLSKFPARITAKGKEIRKVKLRKKSKSVKPFKEVSYQVKLKGHKPTGTLTKRGIGALSKRIKKGKGKETYISVVKDKGKSIGFNITEIKDLTKVPKSMGKINKKFSGNVGKGKAIQGTTSKGITQKTKTILGTKASQNLSREFSIKTVKLGKGKYKQELIKISPITTFRPKTKTKIKTKQLTSLKFKPKTKTKGKVRTTTKIKISTKTRPRTTIKTTFTPTQKNKLKNILGYRVTPTQINTILQKITTKQATILKQILITVPANITPTQITFLFNLFGLPRGMILPLLKKKKRKFRRKRKGAKVISKVKFKPSLSPKLMRTKTSKRQRVVGLAPRLILTKRRKVKRKTRRR